MNSNAIATVLPYKPIYPQIRSTRVWTTIQEYIIHYTLTTLCYLQVRLGPLPTWESCVQHYSLWFNPHEFVTTIQLFTCSSCLDAIVSFAFLIGFRENHIDTP